MLEEKARKTAAEKEAEIAAARTEVEEARKEQDRLQLERAEIEERAKQSAKDDQAQSLTQQMIDLIQCINKRSQPDEPTVGEPSSKKQKVECELNLDGTLLNPPQVCGMKTTGIHHHIKVNDQIRQKILADKIFRIAQNIR